MSKFIEVTPHNQHPLVINTNIIRYIGPESEGCRIYVQSMKGSYLNVTETYEEVRHKLFAE